MTCVCWLGRPARSHLYVAGAGHPAGPAEGPPAERGGLPDLAAPSKTDLAALSAGLLNELGQVRLNLKRIVDEHSRRQERLIKDYLANPAPVDSCCPPEAAACAEGASNLATPWRTAACHSDILSAGAPPEGQTPRRLERLVTGFGRCSRDDGRAAPIAGTAAAQRDEPPEWDQPLSQKASAAQKLPSKVFDSSNKRQWISDLGLENKVQWMEQTQWFKYIDLWMSLEEPPREGALYRFVYSRNFSAACAVVIFLNLIFEVYAVDREVDHWSEGFSEEIWWVDGAFLLYYFVELGLKLVLHRVYFFLNHDWRWNMFDFVLVIFTMYSQIVALNPDASDSTDLSFMRSLRVLKTAKVLRAVRMIRFIAELRLILNSVVGSMLSLFWSFVGLMFIFYIFGLVFVQGVVSHLRENNGVVEEATREKFGSVGRAMLSLYMASSGGDDWGNFYTDISTLGVKNSVLFIAFMLFIQIAVMNIVTGIFVENAMKYAVPDREAIALQQHKKDLSEAEALRQLCMDIDRDNSGRITLHTFCETYESNPRLRDHLAVLGLDIYDAQRFFEILSAFHNDEHVDIDSFVSYCLRLRGFATSIDLQNLMLQSSIIYTSQNRFNDYCKERLDLLTDALMTRRNSIGLPARGRVYSAASRAASDSEASKMSSGTSRKRELIKMALVRSSPAWMCAPCGRDS